ncbi:MAG: cold shock domain-containing protein [Desulfobulbaceae bacterium]|nr:cold shock domain-containing protein [Desulfobulbaceae bacterium]
MELKIEARNLDMRKGWLDKIEGEKEKLIRHYANLVLHLRVTIESTSNHKEGGFEVRVVASVPNDTVVVKRRGEKVHPLLVEAFDVLGMQLKEIVRKKQDHKGVKAQGAVLGGNGSGIIKKLFPIDSYGFIITSDEQEIFFHENVLKDVVMDDLKEGDSVMFGVTEGEMGPQATFVRAEKG